jgi:hypothetical protein
MTEEQIALARRAVACRRWRWLPGMHVLARREVRRGVAPGEPPGCRDTIDPVAGILVLAGFIYDAAESEYPTADAFEHFAWLIDPLPDLTDPATLGCLLALVREAWGCAVITSPDYDYDDDEARQGPNVVGWRAVETVRWMPVGEGKTEAEALVAALEAAP